MWARILVARPASGSVFPSGIVDDGEVLTLLNHRDPGHHHDGRCRGRHRRARPWYRAFLKQQCLTKARSRFSTGRSARFRRFNQTIICVASTKMTELQIRRSIHFGQRK